MNQNLSKELFTSPNAIHHACIVRTDVNWREVAIREAAQGRQGIRLSQSWHGGQTEEHKHKVNSKGKPLTINVTYLFLLSLVFFALAMPHLLENAKNINPQVASSASPLMPAVPAPKSVTPNPATVLSVALSFKDQHVEPTRPLVPSKLVRSKGGIAKANFKINTQEGGDRGYIEVDGKGLRYRSNVPIVSGKHTLKVSRVGYVLEYVEVNDQYHPVSQNSVTLDVASDVDQLRIVFYMIEE